MTTSVFSAAQALKNTLITLSSIVPLAQLVGASLTFIWTTAYYFFAMIKRAREECPHDFFLEIFSIAAWVIWKQRNDKIFRAQAPSITSWKEKFSFS
jgi:hypothetical protein